MEATMTAGATEALKADRAALLDIGSQLEDGEWAAPSGCAGWTVKDVVAHMGALYALVVDRSTLPDVGDVPTEQAQEVYVESRRAWSPGEVPARVAGGGHDLVLWATQRAGWDELGVTAEGDERALAIARRVHVF